jgi:hypothetical protein
MSTPVTQSNEVAPGIVVACTWTGDSTAYVNFSVACGGIALWQGAISRHQPNDMVGATLSSANAATYGAVIMSLLFVNDSVFTVTFSGAINYNDYPFNMINVQVAQFTLADAAAAEHPRPRPLPSR